MGLKVSLKTHVSLEKLEAETNGSYGQKLEKGCNLGEQEG